MKVVFWFSLAIIVYVYAGYPIALAAAAVWRSRATKWNETLFPTVSLIIAAYNEEKVIREKLDNSLALDYPRDRLEIVVASDGSTDATISIAKSYTDSGIILYEITPRGGKTRSLNQVIPKTHGEILVLSDANTMFRPNAIRKLVRHFADPSVGTVSGDVRLVNSAESHAWSEGIYYQYERWLQSLESRLGCLIGADGAMYAVVRTCWRPPANDIILDDFVISMNVARLGYSVLYEPEAMGIEEGTQTSSEEFHRKVRIVAGGMQAIRLREGLPRLCQPMLMFCLVSHKLLRWLVPCFLVFLLLSSIALAYEPIYRLALFGQGVFYSVAVAYAVGVFSFRRLSWAGIAFYFSLVNCAALIGICRGVFQSQTGIWKRTTR